MSPEIKAPWVETRHDPRDKLFPAHPDESIRDWYEQLGLGLRLMASAEGVVQACGE